MEKLLNPYDKEFMRMAMLKHEETFKEQVYELHRLYRIQKIMMKNIEVNRPNGLRQESWNSMNKNNLRQSNHLCDTQQNSRLMKLDLEQPADEYIAESIGGNGELEITDESKIELTLGLSCYFTQRKKPETPLNSDSGPGFSSSSTGSSHILNRKSSLRTNASRREDRSRGRELGVPDIALGYQSGSKISSSDLEEQLRQERLKQPPWLFQVLSLNMT